MGIDLEDIKLCVCRTVHLFIRVSCRFVQQQPYVSGTLLFLFALYIFLPSVLSFLFYSLPFFGLTGILLAFWSSKRFGIQSEKVENKKLEVPKQPTPTINRNRSVYLRKATSRRQRFKDKSEVWRTDSPTNAPVVNTDQSVESFISNLFNEMKELQSSCSGNNASARSTSVDKEIEVFSKKEPLLDSELPVKPNLVACDAANSQANKSDSGGDEMKNESSEDPEDEDEEEALEDKNKAMEWTEDDQRNLMDLGLSEIERNRRLESLIARRRARKLNKRKPEEPAQIVNIFPPGQISKIITATKNDPHNLADGCKEIDQAVPLPGSAPSVLLPMRNPFDLPYDPHEEKPNLMADSFQQEFTAAHQKEVGYCRHESFCFGPVYPEENGAIGYHHRRYRRPSISIADKGEHDWLIEQLLFKGDLHAEKNPIAVETRGIQTEDSQQARDNSAMELESDQEKGILPNSESEFEMEAELTQDSKSQSSHSSSSDNPKDVICDDVRAVSKGFASTLSSALKKSLNCRLPKSRLIKEPLSDFSPTAFDKNKMEERFPYPDKVACHTPAYSIASDLQVEVSELGSPPTVDGNNTDAESLNPDWEIEKGSTFGGEQDDRSSLLESQSNEIVSDLQEEEVKAMSVTEALSTKTIKSPMAEELGEQPSQVVPQMLEELSIPADDDEAINHIVVQKKSEGLANMENTVKTRENVDGGLELLMKQEDDGKKTSSLEEADLKSSKYSDDGPEDSSGCRSRLDHAHSEVGSKNVDLITSNGDPSSAQDHSEEGSKNKDQITGNRDLGLAHEHENKSTDQVTGNGGFVEPKKIEEQLELIQDNKNQPNVVETEFQSSKGALKSTVENDVVTERGVPLDTIGVIGSYASRNQVSDVQSELQRSNDAMKSTVEQHSVTDRGVPLDTIDVIGSDASRNQVNNVHSELQRSNDSMKSTVEQHSISDRGVPLGTIDVIDSDASLNQVNDVQSEFQRSNDAMKSTVEQHSVTDRGVPLDTIDVIGSDASRNQVNNVHSELQRSSDSMKSTVEQHSVSDRGVPLDTIDVIDSDASLNQVNDVQSEFQRSDDAMKSTVEQHSVTDRGVPLDTIDVIDSDASQDQVNDVQSEFQRSKDAMKSTLEEHSVTDGRVLLDSIDVVGSDVSRNQVNDVQSEFRRSNDAMKSPVEQHSVNDGGVPLHTIDIIGSDASQNQVNYVQSEFPKSNDAVKSTVEQDLVNDRGVPLDTIDIGFDASQNQVNVVQSESQKFNDAMKSNVEQHSATERELLVSKAGLSSKSSIEEQIHMDKDSLLQDSIISADHNVKTMESDNNKPADSIEVERELNQDVSGQNGDKFNLDAKDDHEKTDQKLSSPNSAPNNDSEISGSTVQEEVAANPQTETTSTEAQIETELTPTIPLTNKNMEAVGDNKIECETQKFIKLESDVLEQWDLELDNVMESYSKDLNAMGLQKPTDLAHENPLGSPSLSADKESQ